MKEENVDGFQKAGESAASAPGSGSALFQAVASQNAELADTLLKQGANPDVCDSRGYSPLMTAVLQQNTTMVRLLVQHNANLNLQSKNSNMTALMMAADLAGTSGYTQASLDILSTLVYDAAANARFENTAGENALDLLTKGAWPANYDARVRFDFLCNHLQILMNQQPDLAATAFKPTELSGDNEYNLNLASVVIRRSQPAIQAAPTEQPVSLPIPQDVQDLNRAFKIRRPTIPAAPPSSSRPDSSSTARTPPPQQLRSQGPRAGSPLPVPGTSAPGRGLSIEPTKAARAPAAFAFTAQSPFNDKSQSITGRFKNFCISASEISLLSFSTGSPSHRLKQCIQRLGEPSRVSEHHNLYNNLHTLLSNQLQTPDEAQRLLSDSIRHIYDTFRPEAAPHVTGYYVDVSRALTGRQDLTPATLIEDLEEYRQKYIEPSSAPQLR